jgi:hypothetical protein
VEGLERVLAGGAFDVEGVARVVIGVTFVVERVARVVVGVVEGARVEKKCILHFSKSNLVGLPRESIFGTLLIFCNNLRK